jgi:gamma-tubulin complex component 2
VAAEPAPSSRAGSPRPSTAPSVGNGGGAERALAGREAAEGDPIPLSLAPVEVQEALILEDLLYVLTGIEGQYIHYAAHYTPEDAASRLRGASFVVDAALDPSLRGLVERILPLATYYTSIFAFIETESSLEFGTVMHALCAGIRDVLKEYQTLVVQLEHQMATSPTFTLQKLWFFVHPTMRSLGFLHSFTLSIASISHANILESDDEDDDEDEDDDDDDDESEEGDSTASMEREKRAIFAMDGGEADGIIGGIVKGGEVLALLWERVIKNGGDEAAKKLFLTLLHRASQPYAQILLRWINTGHLSDTYEEFLIMENPKVTRASLESDPTDEYWERRYMLRDESVLAQKEHERQQGLDLDLLVEDNGSRGVLTGGAKIPYFLEPWKRKILMAGKYLNVIRECGKDMTQIGDHVDRAAHEEEEIIMTDESFFEQIEQAYQRANAALLHLLLDEHNIIPRLRSMKHYFFQSSADFFSSFLEAAGRELNKEVVAGKVRDVTLMRLQSHLGMVLGSSSCVGYGDPYREDVRVHLATENAYDHLKRIAEIRGGMDEARAQAKVAKHRDKDRVPLMDLLEFDLHVKFPVSLVISKKNILRWQFLQRIIIHLKAMERSLCEVWMEHREPIWRSVEKGHPALQQWKMRILRLRHRILFFVQQVIAFMTEEVLEPNWRDLEVKMEKAKTVDQFLKDHFDFLNTCRKECMLIDHRYLELMSKLMSTAQVFCEAKVHFRNQLIKEKATWQQAKDEGTLTEEPATVSEDVLNYLNKIEGSWDRRLGVSKARKERARRPLPTFTSIADTKRHYSTLVDDEQPSCSSLVISTATVMRQDNGAESTARSPRSALASPRSL